MVQISVIIPTYRPQEYLYNCIASVYDQSLDKNLYELILILNGCDEPYHSIINDYILKFNHLSIILICTEESGVSNARNLGIESSNGDYLCFVDDDDVISYTYLENLLSVSSQTCVGLSNVKGFKADIYKDNGHFFLTKYFDRRNKCKHSFYNFRGYFSVPVAKLIHKSIIAGCRYDIRFNNGEDSLFISNICLRIKEFQFTNDEATYYVRIRNGSLTHRRIQISTLFYLFFALSWEYIKLCSKNRDISKSAFFFSKIPGTFKNIYMLMRGYKK